jgi:hypothetical protein
MGKVIILILQKVSYESEQELQSYSLIQEKKETSELAFDIYTAGLVTDNKIK